MMQDDDGTERAVAICVEQIAYYRQRLNAEKDERQQSLWLARMSAADAIRAYVAAPSWKPRGNDAG